MSAHVTTMRRQDRQQDEQQKNYLKHSQKLIIRSRVHTRRRLTATLSPTNQRAESKGNCWHPRDVIVVWQSIHDLPQIPEHCLPTKYARGTCRSHKDVVMLFCHSYTQPERFLHTDQLITRLRRVEPATCCSHDGLHSHVVAKRDRERVQVRCSDVVGSGSSAPSSMFDILLHLSQSKSCSRSCNLCEAVGNLLTVTMHLQDTLSRFHRPGLHEKDLRVHVASASTRTLAFHESQSC